MHARLDVWHYIWFGKVELRGGAQLSTMGIVGAGVGRPAAFGPDLTATWEC